MKVYKCLKSDFSDLEKKIKRITKKLDRYGLKWEFKVISESIELVPVVDYRNPNNVPLWQFIPKKLDPLPCEVITYTFNMDHLQLGEYEPIAVLEHFDNANMIYTIKEGITIPEKYQTVKSYCEHCNSMRTRNKTVLLQDQDGNIKQVGTTCIKEYTGIDGIDIISGYQDIYAICLEDCKIDYINIDQYPKNIIETIDYLTACIQLITAKGYNKETTKYKAWEIASKDEQNNKHQKTAKQVIQYFRDHQYTDNFLNNIKTALSQEYTKLSGFVAYAYIAYQKELENDKKKAQKQAESTISQHVGKIGDKIQKELTLKYRYSYDTNYTYYGGTSYIYIFMDDKGNQYKWNTSKFLEKIIDNEYKSVNINDKIIVKGTIKEHTEYKGTKQTVLTRCKII